jgi:hydrogenase expression/formation protein HypC
MCLGVPGKVVEVRRHDGLPIVEGKVDFGGILKEVNLSYTPDVREGEYVLVHVGFALSTLDEDEAKRTLGYLEELGRLQEELEAGGPLPEAPTDVRSRAPDAAPADGPAAARGGTGRTSP